jgi:hypothetical protein
MEEDENLLSHVVFSDEAIFHIPGYVIRHNVRIWGTENPNVTAEHAWDSPEVTVNSLFEHAGELITASA